MFKLKRIRCPEYSCRTERFRQRKKIKLTTVIYYLGVDAFGFIYCSAGFIRIKDIRFSRIFQNRNDIFRFAIRPTNTDILFPSNCITDLLPRLNNV